jgi:hypothetical protein
VARLSHIGAIRQSNRVSSCNLQRINLSGESQLVFNATLWTRKDRAMIRPLPSLLVIALAAATPVAARDAGPYYRAELTQPAGKQVIAGGVLWMCEGTACFASKGTGRPVVMCKRLAEAASPVLSFTFGDETLAADDLARCNG